MDNMKYYKRFKKETIYLWNDEAEVYVKSVPEGGYFMKRPGKQEYPVSYHDIVVMAVHGRREVSKEELESAWRLYLSGNFG